MICSASSRWSGPSAKRSSQHDAFAAAQPALPPRLLEGHVQASERVVVLAIQCHPLGALERLLAREVLHALELLLRFVAQ